MTEVQGHAARRSLLGVFIAITAAYVVSVFVEAPSPVVGWANDIVPILVPAVAGVLCLSAATRTRGRERLIWSLFGAGCWSWALGDTAFTILDRTGREPDSFTFADVGYLGLLAFWTVAIAVHPVLARRGVDLASAIVDALTVVAVGSTVMANYVVRPVLDINLPTVDRTFLLIYPVSDLILLAAIVYLFARMRLRPNSASVWIAFAVGLLLAADGSYAVLAASDAYSTGTPTDLLWAGAFVAIGAAALLHRSLTMRPPREGGDSHFIAILASVGTAALVAAATFSPDPWILGIGATLAASLVVVRRALFAFESRRLMRTVREHARLSKEAATAKEAFVAEASHQLRTPLTSMRIRLDLIKMTGLDDPMTLEYLDELSDEVDRLRRLAERLLTLASMEVVTPKQPRDLVKVVAEAAARLARRASLAQVHLRVADLPPKAMVLSAPGALDEALMNLLDNALKFSPPGGTTSIAVERGEGCYEVYVEDDGPGVDEEHADRLFEPFFRVSTQKPGYGLGLAIVKRICDSESAEVSLERRPTGGTRARIRWPMMREDAAMSATSAAAGGSS